MHDLAPSPGLRRPSGRLRRLAFGCRCRIRQRAAALHSAWTAPVFRRLRRLPRLPFAHSSMPFLFISLGALAPQAGCDSGANGRSGAAVTQNPNLSPEALEALKDDVRKSLRTELRPEVVAELRRELTPTIKAELLADLRRTGAPGPDAANADPTPSNLTGPATPPTPGDSGDMKDGDPWSQPGTRIWPSAGGLKLVELVVGTALEDKLPTDVATHYATPPEILYCYSVFENPDPDATVTHVWRRGSRLVSRVELEVGNSPKWRTWSKQRTQPHWTGLWSCEVLDQKGQQLGLTVFQIGG